MSQQLSKSFWLHEFTRSQTAARMGRAIVPTQAEIDALTELCVNVLQPLRDNIGVSITISSGLRPVWLNRAVRGSLSSQHIQGEAADIVAQGFTPRRLCERILDIVLPFDQLILEFDQWTHVSYSVRMRRAVMTARVVDGRTTYLPGLE